MIIPVNSHIIIEPIETDSFVATVKGQYDEIGTVVAIPGNVSDIPFKVGDKVYFDSWTTAKFPTSESGKYHWLVPYSEIRAYEPLP
jgi:co-chaperonin GroES (HSP10)